MSWCVIKAPAWQCRASPAKLQAQWSFVYLATYIFSCLCCKIHSYHDWHSLSRTSNDSDLAEGKKKKNMASHFQKLVYLVTFFPVAVCVFPSWKPHVHLSLQSVKKMVTGVLLIPCVSVITKVPHYHPKSILPKYLWGLKSIFSHGYSPDFTFALSPSSKFYCFLLPFTWNNFQF